MPDIDEPIVIVPYDPSWPAQFDDECRRIAPALGDVATGVEHFGSTAVPGMAGKPIVDLLVGVDDLARASSRIAGLERLGYENFGEIFIAGRIYLRRRGACAFNIAMTLKGGAFWDSQLVLRDYLRGHPDEAAAYVSAKQAAYASGARMFSTYSQGKRTFLEALHERARSWKSSPIR